MSFFDTILEKLGLRKKAQPVPAPAGRAGGSNVAVKDYDRGPDSPKPISDVDVVKKLEGLSAGSGLNWKVSIVDLLKVLDIDSSLEARKELARELGAPADVMNDSARMNIWLHKTVLKKIAQNGGNVPQSLLD
jgi:hypothetical protein